MLSIGKLRGGGAAALYYESQVASGREDYYGESGEAPGVWVGAGAALAGHSGVVVEGELEALLEGDGLRRAPGEKAIAGFDLTFRAPKSVSLMWAIGEGDVSAAVRDAHDKAVVEALGYLERQACRARRGRDGVLSITGDGFVGAAYRHRVSRAQDPLLHTHAVVGNLTHGEDGRWTALDGRHIYRHAKAAGYLYQAVLRDELTVSLGVEWTAVENGTAEIVGIPRLAISAFSRRRVEITRQMALHGQRSARAAQVAALVTREAKPEPVPFAELQELWRARASELGLDPAAIDDLLDRGRPAVELSPIDPRWLTEQESTFGRAELIQRIAQAQRGGATVGEIEQAADELAGDGAMVAVGDRRVQAGVEEPRWSTRDLIEAERRLIDAARAVRDVPTADPHTVDRVTAARPSLNPAQRDLVEGITDSRRAIDVVVAPAGTGKTFAMHAAREAWEASGVTVSGATLSARAAVELNEQTGIETTTVARLTDQIDHGHQLPERSVLVIDEAGMVGTRDLAKLADAVERTDSKLVLVGDDKQLPEIDAGGAFRAIAEQVKPHELDEVLRQTEAWDRDALRELRDGDLDKWAAAYHEHDRITVAETADDVREQLVDAWHNDHTDDKDSIMLAQRRDDVAELNALARERLRDDGSLGRDHTYGDREFAVGDRVITTRNDRDVDMINGQRGTVTRADERGVEIEPDGKHQPTIRLDRPHLEAGDLDHGYAMTVHRAQGATVDTTHVLVDDRTYREWTYTAMSRHRESADIYVTKDTLAGPADRDPDQTTDRLAELVEPSRAKELALAPEFLREPEREPAVEPPHPEPIEVDIPAPAPPPMDFDIGMDLGM